MPIAREGWPYIAVLALLGGGLLLAGLPLPGGVCLALSLFCINFFRDPERTAPEGQGLVISPADGRIVVVQEGVLGPLGPGMIQVSVFMSVFDVHVNRAPIAGEIETIDYHAGEFLPAFDDKASLRNEQNTIVMRDGDVRVAFKQIAGLVARRIVFKKRVKDVVKRGERVGLIKFGSRVDVFLPASARVLVKHGDRVSAGASVLAELS